GGGHGRRRGDVVPALGQDAFTVQAEVEVDGDHGRREGGVVGGDPVAPVLLADGEDDEDDGQEAGQDQVEELVDEQGAAEGVPVEDLAAGEEDAQPGQCDDDTAPGGAAAGWGRCGLRVLDRGAGGRARGGFGGGGGLVHRPSLSGVSSSEPG